MGKRVGRTGCFGFLLLLIQSPVGAFPVAVELRVCSFLSGFPLDLGVYEVYGALSFEFHGCAFRLNFFLHFGVAGFRLPGCLDLGELHVHIELGLGRGEFCFGMGFFRFALCLKDGGLGVDFGDFLSCAAFLFCFANFADHASVGHVDFGLVGSSFMGFAAEELEVFAPLCVLKFLDVCVVAASLSSLEDRDRRCSQEEQLTSSSQIDPIHFEHYQ